jgi:phospholipase/carboxylesterase
MDELLDAIEIDTAADPDACVIWMHGLGDDGRGWSEVEP